jgi:hypothetical protein
LQLGAISIPNILERKKATMRKTLTPCFIEGNYRSGCDGYLIWNYASSNLDLPMILFVEADGYPRSVEALRTRMKWGEIDFDGFSPINAHTLKTSQFVRVSSWRIISYMAPPSYKIGLRHEAG